MSELRDLYQEVILDHNKNPRNFGTLEPADRTVEGYNPLCGDHYTVYLRFDNDRVADVRFHGAGCAISKASASVMSSLVRGKTRAEAEELFRQFHAMVTGELDPVAHADALGKLVAFAGVRDYPARVKCASLAWHTLHAALDNKETTVTTE